MTIHKNRQNRRNLKGAEIIMECLMEEQVETIFGYPGGAVIPLYDALYTYRKHFNHYLTAHEQGAAHAADGYARSTGKTGVVFATSGPGATNTVTGIATAFSDSVPMVVITGQVASPLLGRDSFQEVDITAITMTVTKHNFQVRRVEDLASTVREAFRIASSGRKGPVLVDVPKDLFMTETEYIPVTGKAGVIFATSGPGATNTVTDIATDQGAMNERVTEGKGIEEEAQWEADLRKAAEMINRAERPLIYAGGGVVSSGTSKELAALAEKGEIPVVSSLMGLAGIPGEHPLSLGLVGMHGLRENNLAVCSCDLLITVGARFSDRVTGQVSRFGEGAKVIQLEIDACEVGKNKGVDGSVIGSLIDVLPRLHSLVEPRDRKHWMNEIKMKKQSTGKGDGEGERHWSGVAAIQTANQIFPDSIVVTDVGQHQMWTAQHWKFKRPGTFLTSGGLGTMGYGLGAAIGAKAGNREIPVVLVTGDGSFRMNMNELATAAKYNLSIVILLLNNSSLGMVRQWQGLFCDQRYSETTLGQETDFVKLANAFGIKGTRVENQKDLKAALEEAGQSGGTVVVECRISEDEGVYPIVPPGVGIEEMILGEH